MQEKTDNEQWLEILEQFNKIKEEIGIEPDESHQKDIEELLGMSIEEMNEEAGILMMSETLEVATINEDAVFPSYNYPSDSGFDLYSTIDYKLKSGSRALIPTGLTFKIPEGYEIQIRPKSGLALNFGITVLNTPGTIDSGYLGEVKVILFNTDKEDFQIKKGIKIAQAVLCPVKIGKYVKIVSVDELGDSDRGENGFGSTGI